MVKKSLEERRRMKYFKYKTKIVVSKRFKGDNVVAGRMDGETFVHGVSEKVFPSQLLEKVCETDFVVKASVYQQILYVEDVIFVEDEGFVHGRPWSERYVMLRNRFNWTPSVSWSRSVVVTDADDIVKAVKAVSMTPGADGVFIHGYEDEYFSDKYLLDNEFIENLDLEEDVSV